MTDRLPIELTVNGTRREGYVEARRTLTDFIRQDLQLTGTHAGCEPVFAEPAPSCSTGRRSDRV